MSFYDIVVHIPLLAGILIGAGLLLLIAIFVVIAFFGDIES